MSKQKLFIFLFVIIILALVGGYFSIKNKDAPKILSIEEAKAKVEDFVNNNLMPPGQKVTITGVEEETNLYKITIDVGQGQKIDTYLTKDGKKFFPQAMDTEEIKTASSGQQTANEITNKTDKPAVELFVMSYCPYGTQIEKGIIPVIETLSNKIGFELKFCDYAMHGKTEIDEQLNQYCIQRQEPEKLLSYLKCFLEDGNSDTCLSTVGIDRVKLNTCVSATDGEFKITENFNDQSTWSSGQYPPFAVYEADTDKYGVSGSPTLVINGQKISSGRDASSLLAVICSGFNEQPEECNTELSSVSPAPGFGFEESGDGANGSCN